MSAPCGDACDPVLELCNEDTDECECRPDFELCGDVCVNPVTDHQHCGGCGVACNNNQNCGGSECAGGNCGGLTKCDKSCVDLDADVLHCGGCDSPCLANETCEGGQCVG